MRYDVLAVLERLHVEVKGESDTHYMIFCPFHSNKYTPAATVSKDSGFLYCWNAACGAKKHLVDVVSELSGFGTMRSLRLMSQCEASTSIDDEVNKILSTEEQVFPEFDAATLDKMINMFHNSERAKQYVLGRGIQLEVADKFRLGYDGTRLITPMYDIKGRCIGVIGRSIQGKSFKNSKDLPSSKSLFNIHNARKQSSDFCVICESNFDAIRIWQSGYPSVATLGGNFSKNHQAQLGKYFNAAVIMVDNDGPGRKLAGKIERMLSNVGLSVYEARFSEEHLFPPGAKDASDCTDRQIKQMIQNKSIMTQALL